MEQAQRLFNPVIRDALTAARQKKMQNDIKHHPEFVAIKELRDYCFDNSVPVVGDCRIKSTFVKAIQLFELKKKEKAVVKKKPVLLSVKKPRIKPVEKKEEFDYPADLVKGEPGKYYLFINRESGIKAQVVIMGNGKKCVRVLSATGIFAYLAKDNVHKQLHVPYIAIKKQWFCPPMYMGDKQVEWVNSALKELLRLNSIFESRVKRKKALV